jgi:uncharacterized repeat protein (TIGR03843 family)
VPQLSDDDRVADVLATGEIEVVGRMPWSSNGTFLVEVTDGDDEVRAVYKPARGDRPLWDFPSGLYQREIAAYELSADLGWDLVPVTLEREGPLGPGSLQRFVDADFEHHYFTLREREELDHTFRRLCAFDIVSNNTDRKGGHCLVDGSGRVWAIDNGLSFHAEFKLRTVIWDFSGDEIPDDIRDDLFALLDRGLSDGVASRLDAIERDAVLTRARALATAGHFPVDDGGYRYPWPLV